MAKKTDVQRFHKRELLIETDKYAYFFLCNCEGCVEGRGRKAERMKDEARQLGRKVIAFVVILIYMAGEFSFTLLLAILWLLFIAGLIFWDNPEFIYIRDKRKERKHERKKLRKRGIHKNKRK